MAAVSDASLSPKTTLPTPKEDDSPSLTMRIGLVALACFATLVLGFMTGNVGYSILAATAIGLGGVYCAAATTLFDLNKSKPKPSVDDVDVNPFEKIKQKAKEWTDQHWREMNEALGGENAYDNLPDYGVMTGSYRTYLPNFDHAISRCVGENTKGPRKMLLLKLQKKSGDLPFMCAFHWTQTIGKTIGKDDEYGMWQSNIDHEDRAKPCFPDSIVNETTLEAIKQLRADTHPTYKLVGPKTDA